MFTIVYGTYWDKSKTFSSGNGLKTFLYGVSLADISDKAAGSVVQDQTARMYKLIFLFTICKLYKSMVTNAR